MRFLLDGCRVLCQTGQCFGGKVPKTSQQNLLRSESSFHKYEGCWFVEDDGKQIFHRLEQPA